MTDVFEEARARLTMEEVARHYGFTPNRSGFICCPFHGEKTPSLRIYPEGKGWHCFGCGAGGSVVDFVGQLFGLAPLEAVRKLDTDFSLGLEIDHRPTDADRRAAHHRAEMTEIRRTYDAWRWETIRKLNTCFRVAHLLDKPLDKMTEAEIQAIKWQLAIEEWSDCLMSDNLEDQMKIFRDRKGVAAVCNRILACTPTKSEAA